ncbi:MAG: PP2C family protein-serine/threonine phosphatase [Lachnospiraceae bacterium]|nr:PP2C family protein-serine/threonine phosphatase [Lachnospiraceae bacterium]
MKRRLAIKFNSILILMGVLIFLVTVGIGGYEYYQSIVNLYNEQAYQTAAMASTFFSDEQLYDWSETAFEVSKMEDPSGEIQKVTEDPEYVEILDHIRDLRDSVDANDIFVFVVDTEVLNNYTVEAHDAGTWRPMIYLADCYRESEYDFLFGDTGKVAYDYIGLMDKAIKTGEKPTEKIISDGGFGNNISAMYPVVRDGKTVLMVGVEIPMVLLERDLKVFMIVTLIAAAIATAILLLITSVHFARSIISPIKMISSEAGNFIENENQISEKLKTVKTKDEIQTLSEALLKMEIGINEYIDNLTRVTAEKERIGAELNIATQIQADMLPCIFPPFPEKKELDIYASMTPAKEVGGDFYDFFLLDDDHLALVMADVSGKGVPAALFMVISKTLIKDQAQSCRSPKTILETVNNQLNESNAQSMFVTVWLGIMEISTGKLVAANAGHEYPLLKGADGGFELIKDKHGMVLGAMEDLKYKEYELEVPENGCLFLYTDGVPEATDDQNNMFGTDRLLEALNEDPGADSTTLLKNVKKKVDEFVGGAPQFDDLTMLAVRRVKI